MLSAQLIAELPHSELPPEVEAETYLYKSVEHTDLKLHVLRPRGVSGSSPAILFFFPGGWRHGKLVNFLPHAQAMVEEGWVAILADYRVGDRHGTEPKHAVEDALDCYAWLRGHSARLGLALDNLVVAGGSSGGHLAACVGLFEFQDGRMFYRTHDAPAALVLFNPVLDVAAFAASRGDKLTISDPVSISPMAQLHAPLPPTLIMHGTADRSVPVERTEEFARRARALGLDVTVIVYPEKVHGFYNPQKDPEGFEVSVRDMKKFLRQRELLT